MDLTVVAFSDTYLPSINGVTYTIRSWRSQWERLGGRMDVVYPKKSGYEPDRGEHPVRSIPFPFYDEFQLGLPLVPAAVPNADIVHLHGPFTMGLSGLRCARSQDVPIVASYHTPTSQYAEYLSSRPPVAHRIERTAQSYERWFYKHVDLLIAPSEASKRHFVEKIDIETPATVVTNGVDVDRFRPVDASAFLERYGIDDSRPIVGYTGRHGFEKNLDAIVEATKNLDVTVVIAGDGPANATLRERADSAGLDAHFLGYIDREELPAFYSALDVFAFPSPVETQGLVALEAYACGTPVAGVNEGALADTIVDGETGYHYERGRTDEFERAIVRTLEEKDRLRENCLNARDEFSLTASTDRLAAAYDRVL